jgi:hypothetical protein
MEDMRKVEVLKNGKWQSIEFKDICKGDIFRLFESTGEPVIDNNGKTEFVAKSEPYITSDGVLGVDIE